MNIGLLAERAWACYFGRPACVPAPSRARGTVHKGKGEVVRKFQGNPWAVLLVVSLGFFMTLLDLTIVNIAIPNLITKLHASLDDVLWVINAYALVLAVLVITAGRLGDLVGPRVMFSSGVAVFTAASAACGFAPSPGWLIAFRRERVGDDRQGLRHEHRLSLIHI